MAFSLFLLSLKVTLELNTGLPLSYFSSFHKCIFNTLNYVYLCEYVHVSASALRGQGCPTPLELELETIVSALTWGTGN